MTKKESVQANIRVWDSYSLEYFNSSEFSDNLLHIGLGLKGIQPDDIYNGQGRLLDIGCGNGLNTFLLAKISQNNVTGIDPVENGIALAKTKYKLPNLRFHIASFDEIFDSPACQEVPFNNITFFGSLDYLELDNSFFHILNKITKSHSKCFIAKFHPFWTNLFDNDTDCENIKTYYEVGRKDKVVYGNSFKKPFTRFHYPLSYLFQIFLDAGWHLDRFEEPEPDLAHSAFSYKGYDTDSIMIDRLSKIPMTIVLEFTRAKL
jgi:SAM-dependent methyltransferase